jgi:recombination protein RecA
MARKKSSAPPENGMNKARQTSLDKALGDITKRFGDGAIMKLGEAHSLLVEAIPTGCLSLDIALGVGGIPRGRVTEIYGPESSGKTTLCLHILAEAQKMGGTAAFVDMEHALDPDYAARLGVDIDNLLISQPDMGEQALEITETLVRSGAVDIVAIDSVAALVPRSELEGDMGDATMGVQARLMSQALRKLSGAIKQTNTAVIFTNQLRQKIGIMFGNPETTTGGMALKFYSSVRIDIRRMQAIKVGGDIVGNLLDLAVELDIINKRGSYYYYGEENLAQGRENAKDYLRENPDLAYEVETIIRQELLDTQAPPPMVEKINEEDLLDEEFIEEDIED